MSDQIIVLPGNTAYLAGAAAAVTFANSAQMFGYKDPELLPFQKNKKKYRGIVPWGDDNDLPDKIIESVYNNPVMTSGMLFNIQIGYGDGIVPVIAKWNDGFTEKDVAVTPVLSSSNQRTLKYHVQLALKNQPKK